MLCLGIKFIHHNERFFLRVRQAHYGFWSAALFVCNYWRRIVVLVNQEQRQVMYVFWGTVSLSFRTSSEFVKRHGCSFEGLHSAAATVQSNRWQAPTADNLCVGYLPGHSGSTLCNRYAVDIGTLRARRCGTHTHTHTHTHTRQAHLFEPL